MGGEESEKTASYYTNQYPIGVVDLQHCWNDISRLYIHTPEDAKWKSCVFSIRNCASNQNTGMKQ